MIFFDLEFALNISKKFYSWLQNSLRENAILDTKNVVKPFKIRQCIQLFKIQAFAVACGSSRLVMTLDGAKFILILVLYSLFLL